MVLVSRCYYINLCSSSPRLGIGLCVTVNAVSLALCYLAVFRRADAEISEEYDVLPPLGEYTLLESVRVSHRPNQRAYKPPPQLGGL